MCRRFDSCRGHNPTVARTLQRGDVEVAVEALPHVNGYLARHQDRDDVRLVVRDEQGDETLTVPRGAVELLARIPAHMAAGQA